MLQVENRSRARSLRSAPARLVGSVQPSSVSAFGGSSSSIGVPMPGRQKWQLGEVRGR